jgi:hypothetical protein
MPHHVFKGDVNDRLLMQEDAAVEILQPRLVHEQNDHQQVNDDREPRSFAAARASEVVLQMEQESRDGVLVEMAVSRLPMTCVVEAGSILSRGWAGIARRYRRNGHQRTFSL